MISVQKSSLGIMLFIVLLIMGITKSTLISRPSRPPQMLLVLPSARSCLCATESMAGSTSMPQRQLLALVEPDSASLCSYGSTASRCSYGTSGAAVVSMVNRRNFTRCWINKSMAARIIK